MGAVQQAQLGAVVRSDIVGHDDSGTFPVRPLARGAILDDPLHEAFALYGPTVCHAEHFTNALAQIIGRRGRDAVDHGARECHLLLDPTRQVAIISLCKLLYGPSEARSIVDEVVATDDGQRPNAARASAPQRFDEIS